MPKLGNNWGVETTELDPNCNPQYGSDEKLLNVQVQMDNTRFADGSIQSLDWPEGHDQAGVFKGMAVILQERGFEHAPKLPTQCEKFKCKPDAINCCCHRILYNQPDFVNVPSILEKVCKQ